MAQKLDLNNIVVSSLVIPAATLVNKDISLALNLYEEELKWDSERNYRAIHIQFEHLNKLTVNEMAILKFKWYRHLIEQRPEFMYYLVEEQFFEVLTLLLCNNPLNNVMHFQETQNTTDFPKLEPKLKQYLLDTVEDLTVTHDAPVNLMATVYNEIYNFKEIHD